MRRKSITSSSQGTIDTVVGGKAGSPTFESRESSATTGPTGETITNDQDTKVSEGTAHLHTEGETGPLTPAPKNPVTERHPSQGTKIETASSVTQTASQEKTHNLAKTLTEEPLTSSSGTDTHKCISEEPTKGDGETDLGLPQTEVEELEPDTSNQNSTLPTF